MIRRWPSGPFVALPTIVAPPRRPPGRGMVMVEVNFGPRCVYGRWRYGHDGHRNDQPFDRRELDRRHRRHGVARHRTAPGGPDGPPADDGGRRRDVAPGAPLRLPR